MRDGEEREKAVRWSEEREKCERRRGEGRENNGWRGGIERERRR